MSRAAIALRATLTRSVTDRCSSKDLILTKFPLPTTPPATGILLIFLMADSSFCAHMMKGN
ncbi:hypothetical protein ACTXT7_004479 [Hymenolepis weldensis]